MTRADGTIIVDIKRFGFKIKKDKTLVQVRDINAINLHAQTFPESFHIAYSMGRNTTNQVTMKQLADFLEDKWDLNVAGPVA